MKARSADKSSAGKSSADKSSAGLQPGCSAGLQTRALLPASIHRKES
jgi:hypothetical protein